MRKKLLDKVITDCYDCPMMDNEMGICNYTKQEIEHTVCPLPDAPVTKILKITKCIDCIYCKMSDVGTCIDTYPPHFLNNYDCWKGAFHMRSEDCVNAGIHENCPLEDEEE